MANNDSNKIRTVVTGVVALLLLGVLSFLADYESRMRKLRITRQPYVNRYKLREANINSILCCGDTYCLGQIRMRPIAFL